MHNDRISHMNKRTYHILQQRWTKYVLQSSKNHSCSAQKVNLPMIKQIVGQKSCWISTFGTIQILEEWWTSIDHVKPVYKDHTLARSAKPYHDLTLTDNAGDVFAYSHRRSWRRTCWRRGWILTEMSPSPSRTGDVYAIYLLGGGGEVEIQLSLPGLRVAAAMSPEMCIRRSPAELHQRGQCTRVKGRLVSSSYQTMVRVPGHVYWAGARLRPPFVFVQKLAQVCIIPLRFWRVVWIVFDLWMNENRELLFIWGYHKILEGRHGNEGGVHFIVVILGHCYFHAFAKTYNPIVFVIYFCIRWLCYNPFKRQWVKLSNFLELRCLIFIISQSSNQPLIKCFKFLAIWCFVSGIFFCLCS
jgi:hypothetical protein